MAVSSLADTFDPRPADEAKFERAIARRNIAHTRLYEADQALAAMRLRGVVDLSDWIGAYNGAQNEYEHASRDLVWARVVFQADTVRR